MHEHTCDMWVNMHAKKQTEVSSGIPSSSCGTLACCSPIRLVVSWSSHLGLSISGISSMLRFYTDSGDRTQFFYSKEKCFAGCKLSLSRLSCLRTHCVLHTGLKPWQSSCLSFPNAESPR